MTTGPCNWPAPNTACQATFWASLSPDVQAYATTLANFGLWSLTGRRFGLCDITVRPCNAPSLPPLYQVYPVNLINPWGTDEGNTYYPLYIYNGVWHNAGCMGINCCGATCEVLLDGPVGAVTSVVVDGATVDPSAYRIDNGYILVRTDNACWPMCQDLNKDSGTNTFMVTYQRGEPVPPVVTAAAGILAVEIAKACTGATCRLPVRMQSLSRQGVSVQFVTPNDYLDRGLTNLFEVDQVVAQLNPGRLWQRPKVLSMDQSPNRVTTIP